MGCNLAPIFLFYLSYLQETTSTCHRHPKLTEFLMQIGFPDSHTREKSREQLGRHYQTQKGSTRVIGDGDPASQLLHSLCMALGLCRLLLEVPKPFGRDAAEAMSTYHFPEVAQLLF